MEFGCGSDVELVAGLDKEAGFVVVGVGGGWEGVEVVVGKHEEAASCGGSVVEEGVVVVAVAAAGMMPGDRGEGWEGVGEDVEDARNLPSSCHNLHNEICWDHTYLQETYHFKTRGLVHYYSPRKFNVLFAGLHIHRLRGN